MCGAVFLEALNDGKIGSFVEYVVSSWLSVNTGYFARIFIKVVSLLYGVHIRQFYKTQKCVFHYEDSLIFQEFLQKVVENLWADAKNYFSDNGQTVFTDANPEAKWVIVEIRLYSVVAKVSLAKRGRISLTASFSMRFVSRASWNVVKMPMIEMSLVASNRNAFNFAS